MIKFKMFSAFLFISILINSCNQDSSKSTKDVIIKNNKIQSNKEKNIVLNDPNEVSFNIPNMLDKNIDQIEDEFGKPKEEDSSNLSVSELERRYNRNGFQLVITYNTETRNIESIAIAAESGKVKNCSILLKSGGLSLQSSNYSIDSLEIGNEGYYGSIVVTK